MSTAKLRILTVRPKVITRVMSSPPGTKVKDRVKETETLNSEPEHCSSTINLAETEIFKITNNDGEMLKILRKSGKADFMFCGQVVIQGLTEEVNDFKVKIKEFLARKDNKDVAAKPNVNEDDPSKQLGTIMNVKLDASEL